MPPNHHILCCPLLFLPSILLNIRVFSNESVLCIRRSKDWSFSFSISSSNEYSELISFRIDWLDLLAVPGTLKNLLQHHSSKASILQRSAFCIVQLSHPYMTTGKTVAFTRQTFVGKVVSLLFNRYWTNINFLVFKTIIIVGGNVNIRGSWAGWWIFENFASFCKSSVILKWSQNRKSKKYLCIYFLEGCVPC